jgi:endonuclease/exonuclease/phosphatase family metal-dependent hydrolase
LAGTLAAGDPPPLAPEETAVQIGWQDAGQYVGRDGVVYGKVIQSKTTRNWCFLNFHEDYRSTFTAAIPRRFFDRFPKPPEEMYAGQEISVCGRITEFQGKPEIIVSDPDRIKVGVTLPSDAQAPRKTTSQPSKPRTFDGSCTVATYNLLNLFDELDDPYHGDQGTRPKPREQLEPLAETIRRLDADVLALQEVENRGYLKRFVEAMIPDLGYEHIVLFEGNDYRGIDVALLSRLPVGPVTSYRHLRFPAPDGHMMSFRRDLLRVRIEPPGVAPFDVFVVHLKSKRGQESDESLAVRMGEAGQIRRVFDGRLAAEPNARFVICGDFNDTFDSKPLKTIVGSGSGALGSFADDLPADNRATYNKEPYRSMIDFILASPAMTKSYRQGSHRIIPGSISASGSDHNPVAATFDLK